MNTPAGYSRLSNKSDVYYADVQKRDNNGETRKCVGIGRSRFPDIMLEPSEALALLAWLQQEREELERLAKDEKHNQHRKEGNQSDDLGTYNL